MILVHLGNNKYNNIKINVSIMNFLNSIVGCLDVITYSKNKERVKESD